MTTIDAFEPESGAALAARAGVTQPDGRAYVPYRYDAKGDIALHVRIALATGRPLLLLGPPGAGKSTLARDVALCLGRRYYERVITSRTQARDLQWRWDAVARLADAQVEKRVDHPARYVEPDVLWWAFAPDSAALRGATADEARAFPPVIDPYWRWKRGDVELTPGAGSVVLLDEIDKADPDVPNDLLLALGERRFVVEETRRTVDADPARPCLVFITSNGERDLPPAFLRRCITLTLELPQGDVMKDILRRHVPTLSAALVDTLVARHEAMVAAIADTSRPPGTAELIDAARAADHLLDGKRPRSIGPDTPDPEAATLERVLAATVWKRPDEVPKARPA